jgi:hypothetical protein
MFGLGFDTRLALAVWDMLRLRFNELNVDSGERIRHALQGDGDVWRRDLDCSTTAVKILASDHRCAGAEEGIKDNLIPAHFYSPFN